MVEIEEDEYPIHKLQQMVDDDILDLIGDDGYMLMADLRIGDFVVMSAGERVYFDNTVDVQKMIDGGYIR